MSRIIERQNPQQCDLCGKIAELRPYGPKGEKVCFPCGMKDEEAAKKRFQEEANRAVHFDGKRPDDRGFSERLFDGLSWGEW